MALSAAICWEVRSATGADTNGGGFKTGATGTDYSQQTSPQYALTGLASAGSGNVVLSASAAANMVGNVGQCTSGTNFVAGLYEITSVSVGVSITFSTNTAGASICSGVGASGVINIGGALASLQVVKSNYTVGNKIFATGGETCTATTTFSVGGTPTTTQNYTRIIGYTSSRTDGGRYKITLSTNTGLIGLSATGVGIGCENIEVDCANLGTSTGISIGGQYGYATNCKVYTFKTAGITLSGGNCACLRNDVSGGVTGATAAINASFSCQIQGNFVHENVCHGILFTTSTSITGNIIVNNTGTSDGIIGSGNIINVSILGNTVHNNGRTGISFGTGITPNLNIIARGNILTSNVTYGLDSAGGAICASYEYDGNAYWNNGTARHNVDSTGGNNATASYTNVYDVTLTGSPYTNATTDPTTANWGLNNTAGAGKACRGTFGPSTWPGNTTPTTSYQDFGAVQHQDSGSGGGSAPTPIIGVGGLVQAGA